MERSLNIMVGGERPRIRCEIAGDTLVVIASKCYAEYCQQLKFASEGKAGWPAPQGSETPRDDGRPALCTKDMGANQVDMGVRFPDAANAHIRAFLKGEDVPSEYRYDSLPEKLDKPKTYTRAEVEAIAVTAAQKAVAAATKSQTAPVSESVEVVESTVIAPQYEMDGRSAKEVAFAEELLAGMMPIEAARKVGYKRPEGALKKLTKIPVLAQIMADMENAG